MPEQSSTGRPDCDARVAYPPHYLHDYPCQRKATKTRTHDGVERHLCTQHAAGYDRLPKPSAYRWGWIR